MTEEDKYLMLALSVCWSFQVDLDEDDKMTEENEYIMVALSICWLFQVDLDEDDKMTEENEYIMVVLSVCWLFQANIDEDDRMTEEDESLMVALSVATAVGLLFMVLGLVFWRRNRRRNLYYYRTEGYGKVRFSNVVWVLPGAILQCNSSDQRGYRAGHLDYLDKCILAEISL